MAQEAQSSIVVRVPVERAYDYWRTLENLPRFMTSVEEVSPAGDGLTHWRVRGPLGTEVEFDARTTRSEPNRLIAWQSVGGDVGTSGEVRFEPLGEERARIEVTMTYGEVPGGALGEAAAKLLSNPQVMLDGDLGNFKRILEGSATPEEVQRSIAAARSGLAASGAGLALAGGLLVLLLLLRRRRRRRRRRIIVEF